MYRILYVIYDICREVGYDWGKTERRFFRDLYNAMQGIKNISQLPQILSNFIKFYLAPPGYIEQFLQKQIFFERANIHQIHGSCVTYSLDNVKRIACFWD